MRVCVCACAVSVRMGRSGVGTGGQKSKLFHTSLLVSEGFPYMIQFFDETIFHVSFHVIVRARRGDDSISI